MAWGGGRKAWPGRVGGKHGCRVGGVEGAAVMAVEKYNEIFISNSLFFNRKTHARARIHQSLASRPLQPIRKDLVIRFRRQRLAREAIMAAKEMSVKKYVVRLSGEERERLETLIRKGKSPARRVLKARILLKADVSEAGKGWSDNRIIEALETSPSMVYRVR